METITESSFQKEWSKLKHGGKLMGLNVPEPGCTRNLATWDLSIGNPTFTKRKRNISMVLVIESIQIQI
jgi:hypothetical protein